MREQTDMMAALFPARKIMSTMELNTKYKLWEVMVNSGLPAQSRTVLVMGVLLASGGVVWRDKKGYHARAFNRNKVALEYVQRTLGGGKVVFNVRARHWVWGVDRKSIVDWLYRQMTALFPPATQPDRLLCRHCGGQDGYHEQECHAAPGE